MQKTLDSKEIPQFDLYDLDFEITIPKDTITMGPQSNSCPWACTATCGGSCTPPKCY
ncbi:MAG: hypothetical protein HKM07_02095 [Chlamydiae bacterium]|nr:hypothetical protein [Chlamydiota bacterium]